VNGFDVMAFDEAFAVVAIALAEVKAASFARQSTERRVNDRQKAAI
jgi:hypothetical protein